MHLVEDSLDVVSPLGATEEFRSGALGSSGYGRFCLNDAPNVVSHLTTGTATVAVDSLGHAIAPLSDAARRSLSGRALSPRHRPTERKVLHGFAPNRSYA